ncbi:MAG: hypothetical protein ACE5HY_01055 [Candidatus Hydrothermarchaeales archaeon]
MDQNIIKGLHALALLSIVGGFYRTTTISAANLELRVLVMIEYLVWAILFELLVINLKE